MAGFSAHGATFTFQTIAGQLSANVTGLSVELPTAEVVDMTSTTTALGFRLMVPTGEVSGGSIQVDYIASRGGAAIEPFLKRVGNLVFACPGYTVAKRAILQSASQQASVGDAVRGTLTFAITDYQGT